jgi:hypothetical protein
MEARVEGKSCDTGSTTSHDERIRKAESVCATCCRRPQGRELEREAGVPMGGGMWSIPSSIRSFPHYLIHHILCIHCSFFIHAGHKRAQAILLGGGAHAQELFKNIVQC